MYLTSPGKKKKGYSHSSSVYYAISAHRNVVHDARRYNTLAIIEGGWQKHKAWIWLFLPIRSSSHWKMGILNLYVCTSWIIQTYTGVFVCMYIHVCTNHITAHTKWPTYIHTYLNSIYYFLSSIPRSVGEEVYNVYVLYMYMYMYVLHMSFEQESSTISSSSWKKWRKSQNRKFCLLFLSFLNFFF